MLTHKLMRFFIYLTFIVWSGISFSSETMDEYLDLSARYSHGDFDTSLSSQLYQFQLTYGKFFDSFDASVSSSYIQLSDELGEDTGIGDIYLRAGTTLSNKRNFINELYGSIQVKLPTADESTGLGTGEPDLGVFLNYTHRVNSTGFMLTGGYTITGDSSVATYKDIFHYGMGISTYFDNWYLYGHIDGQQQRLDSGSNPLVIGADFFYQLKAARFIKMEITSGLNDASADLGITIGYVLWF